MKKTYIVIGASAAGIGALTKLRTLDKEATIICVTAEKEMPYNRCLLADYLAGTKTIDDVATKKSDFFTTNNITLILDAQVTKIIPDQHKILVSTGRSYPSIPQDERQRSGARTDPEQATRVEWIEVQERHLEFTYDKLFIGAGRSTVMPKIPGYNLAGVFPFYDLSDVTKILAYITEHKPKKAIVIGAGLSGVECADALTHHEIPVTLIERAAHLLPHQLDLSGAQLLEKIMNLKNVTIRANTSVQEISCQNTDQNTNTPKTVTHLTLSNHEVIPCDIVIFAIGGRTNSWLASDAGLETLGNGILVNSIMQTSNPDIFAGGDICMIKDKLSNDMVQSCLWPDAVMQGMTAAHGMIGTPKEYQGTLIVTSSHIFGTTFVTCGPVTNSEHNYQEVIRQNETYYHKFLLHEKKLKGFIMVGNVDKVGQLRRLLQEQTEAEL